MVGVPRKPSKPVDPNQSWDRATLLPMEMGSAGDVRPAVPQMLLDLWDALTLPGDVLTGKVDPMSDEGIGRAAGFPAQIAMPGLGAASVQALTQGLDPNMLNVFIGPKGARNLGTLGDFERADAMAAKKDYKLTDQMVEDIFAATGVFPGKDTKWRQEVPDVFTRGPELPPIDANYAAEIEKQIALRPHWSDVLKANVASANVPRYKIGTQFLGQEPAYLPDFMNHPALMEAYPELAGLDTSISAYPSLPGQQGIHYPAWGDKPARIQAQGPTETDINSVLLHELQHWIQQKEGFTTGGNSEFTKNIVANVAPQADQQLEIASPYTLYKALAGETESRNVQTRYELGTALDSPFQLSPLETEDIPRNLQVPVELLNTLPGAGSPGHEQLLKLFRMLGQFQDEEQKRFMSGEVTGWPGG